MSLAGRITYGDFLNTSAGRLQEEQDPTELELQAEFFQGKYGVDFVTHSGRKLRLFSAGEWNREPGPDFKNAILAFDTEEPQSGDLELDLSPLDWERHGHADNPAFEKVLVQFVFKKPQAEAFARTLSHRQVEQVTLEKPPLDLRLEREQAATDPHLVEAAAFYRLIGKGQIIQRSIRLQGVENALFGALAAGLGYKNNSLAMMLLSQRVGLRRALRINGEALLFGVSGFLDRTQLPVARETETYLRELWAEWWKLRSQEERLILSANNWKLGGQRPANHPHRRVGALCALIPKINELAGYAETLSPKAIQEIIRSAFHTFWSHHYNLQGDFLPSPHALIGTERTNDLLINIFAPLWLQRYPDFWPDFCKWKSPTVPAVIRNVAARLGIESQIDLSLVFVQQGLLQIRRDFGSSLPEKLWQSWLQR